MPNLRILTAGESHGKALIGILEGMPAGVQIDKEKVDEQLKRRQSGLGRGGRMQIESDRVEILSGLRFGRTIGSPIAILIENKDWPNWKDRMNPYSGNEPNPVSIPRPGHADYAGSVKYNHTDLRNVFERASARETAVRVALGSIVRQFLELFDIWIGSHVIQIHEIRTENTFIHYCDPMTSESLKIIRDTASAADFSIVRCADASAAKQMIETIRTAKEKGDTAGGIFEVAALNVPIGLGSHVFWDRRLDAAIASAFMSIPGIKSVEIGLGVLTAQKWGSEVHDAFGLNPAGSIHRTSNRAGGIEGGISNGEPILVRAAMKPIPTLKNPLPSIHLKDKNPAQAHQERSDVCAVPSAGIVGEAMLAIEIGKAFCERYGGDSLNQMKKHYEQDQSK